MSDTSAGDGDARAAPASVDWAALFERDPAPLLALGCVEDPAVVAANQAYRDTFTDAASAEPNAGVAGQRADLEPAERDALAAVRSGSVGTASVTRRTRSGVRRFAVEAVPVDAGEVTAFLRYRDQTTEHIREQQCTVLCRVLRHNLRNTLTVLLGYATRIHEHAESHVVRQAAETIVDGAEEFRRIADAASRLHAVTAERVDQPLSEAVERVERDLGAAFSDGLLVDAPATGVEIDGRVGFCLKELCQLFAEHAPATTANVDATVADDRVRITVAADAPLDAHQIAALEGQEETKLQHATGVGAWLARWALRGAGGQLRVDDAGPERTVCTLTAPAWRSRDGDCERDARQLDG